MTEAPESALAIGAWSHVWSSAVSVDLRRAAWEALELPESFEDCKQEYWNVFQVGSDGPRISLLLHHALGRPGSSVREDWLRVMNHLGLQWNEVHLPPDQLGAACEVYACARSRATNLCSSKSYGRAICCPGVRSRAGSWRRTTAGSRSCRSTSSKTYEPRAREHEL